MNLNNNSIFNNLNSEVTTIPSIEHQWLDIKEQMNDFELSQQYADIFQKHGVENKWVLVLTPQTNSLEQLNSSSNIDTSKVLQVNTNKVKINIKNVKTALSKGNCAAVVLCNASLKESELEKLTSYAQQGKTRCIVLNNKTLH